MQGCSKENKVTCPVTSAGFQSYMFHRFLGEETHYLIHTESGAWSPWLCRSDPKDPKYILLAKATFQWSVWPGQATLCTYSQRHLCKIVVSLPQWHLNRKGKLISSLCWKNTRTSLYGWLKSSQLLIKKDDCNNSMNIKTHSRIFYCLECSIYWNSYFNLNRTFLEL